MSITPKNRIPNYKDFVEVVHTYTVITPTLIPSSGVLTKPPSELLETDDFTYEPTEDIYLTTAPSCNSTYITIPPTQLPLVAKDYINTKINTNTDDKNMYYATISVSVICFFIVFFYLHRLYYVNRYKIQKIQNTKHPTVTNYYEYNSQF